MDGRTLRSTELGEVKYHITANAFLHSVMVTVPEQGIYPGELGSILQLEDSLNGSRPSTEKVDGVVMTLGEDGRFRNMVETVISTLDNKLPSQCVLEECIIVDRLLITKSHKVNRKEMNS